MQFYSQLAHNCFIYFQMSVPENKGQSQVTDQGTSLQMLLAK